MEFLGKNFGRKETPAKREAGVEDKLKEEEGLFTRALEKVAAMKDSAKRLVTVRSLATAIFLAQASTAMAQSQNSPDIFDETKNKDSVSAQINSLQTPANIKDRIQNLFGKFSLTFSQDGSTPDLSTGSSAQTKLGYRYFYNQLSAQEYHQVADKVYDPIGNGKSLTNFRLSIQENSPHWNANQKLLILSDFGIRLGAVYDMSMVKGTYGDVTDESIYAALSAWYKGDTTVKSGLCTQHHDFLAKMTSDMGLQAWVQAGLTPTNGHAIAGFLINYDGKDQIAFNNYGKITLTGTTNYRDALSFMERSLGNISLINDVTDSAGKVIGSQRSRASDEVSEIAGIPNTNNVLEHSKERKTDAIEVNISENKQKLELTRGHFGLEIVNYTNTSEYYNSLAKVKALGASYENNIKGVHLEFAPTIIHAEMRSFVPDSDSNKLYDITAQNSATTDLIQKLAIDYFGNKQISASEYGKFMMEMGGTIQAASKYAFGMPSLKGDLGVEGGLSAKLVYINPANTGEFYIQAEQTSEVTFANIRAENLRGLALLNSGKIRAGGIVEVVKGTLVNFNAAIQHELARDTYEAGLGFQTPNFAFTFTTNQQRSSVVQMATVSKTELAMTKTLKQGNIPLGEINLFGNSSSDNDGHIQTGLRAKVFLW